MKIESLVFCISEIDGGSFLFSLVSHQSSAVESQNTRALIQREEVDPTVTTATSTYESKIMRASKWLCALLSIHRCCKVFDSDYFVSAGVHKEGSGERVCIVHYSVLCTTMPPAHRAWEVTVGQHTIYHSRPNAQHDAPRLQAKGRLLPLERQSH